LATVWSTSKIMVESSTEAQLTLPSTFISCLCFGINQRELSRTFAEAYCGKGRTIIRRTSSDICGYYSCVIPRRRRHLP